MWIPAYSKAFAEKIRGFTAGRAADVQKTVERVLTDPTLNQYKRPYLTPHQQDHPTDKTLTVFFEVLNASRNVFFSWVNDDNHPHDTRKNHGDDPCIKEFLRLKGRGEIETFSQVYHDGEFLIRPRPNAPVYASFKKYGVSVFASILTDGAAFYIIAVGNDSASDTDIFDHYELFFEKLREHFLSQRRPFEIRVLSADNEFEQLVRNHINVAEWREDASSGDICWLI